MLINFNDLLTARACISFWQTFVECFAFVLSSKSLSKMVSPPKLINCLALSSRAPGGPTAELTLIAESRHEILIDNRFNSFKSQSVISSLIIFHFCIELHPTVRKLNACHAMLKLTCSQVLLCRFVFEHAVCLLLSFSVSASDGNRSSPFSRHYSGCSTSCSYFAMQSPVH